MKYLLTVVGWLFSIHGALTCHFGLHKLRKDPGPVNGVWWAFCERCGARHGGEYDMATGETIWKLK